MATSSIFQEVRIKDKSRLHRLLHALERSQNAPAKPVVMSRPVHIMTKDEMRRAFGEPHDRV